MTWEFSLTATAEKQFSKLPQDAQAQIAKAIDAMEQNPFAGDARPLKGKELKGRYRRRVGRYRIIFSADPATHQGIIYIIIKRDEQTYK